MISQVSTIIFNLLVLGGIRNSQGKVWRCHPDQLYVVEVSLPNLNNENFNNSDSEYLTTSLLSLFPTISCLTPRKSLHNLKTSQICEFLINCIKMMIGIMECCWVVTEAVGYINGCYICIYIYIYMEYLVLYVWVT